MRPLLRLLLCCLIVPVVSQAPAQARTAATDAPTQYVMVNGANIAYRSVGRGQPMLLANRMRGTIDTWDPLFVDEVARHFQVIVFDYPGIGYSSGPQLDDLGKAGAFVADLAAALKIQRFVAAGWSWGGLVTQALLIDHPERVSHAVLIGTTSPGKPERPISPLFLERAFKPYNDLADDEILFFYPASDRSREANRLSRERIYARSGVAEHIPSTRAQIQAYLTAAKDFHEDTVQRRAKLTQSRVPILILCGDNDPSVPVQNWFPLVGQIDANLVVMPQSGHAPHHQYPELSARYIADFVSATSSKL